ncbi:hypothetical protein [Spiroplasma tabanidicola]|uniref:Uncharacterized protein n=1 Tax=Spiroplasma tabanidicola TaxID=324079 RepID=A0A6I6C9B5_9MOLU|nr:hypothetical protein [Spiroplasma tabanidicola]QGS51491.1 hypothetical protein STABA_v1c01240 [Spiroplasma tabanidicola]
MNKLLSLFGALGMVASMGFAASQVVSYGVGTLTYVEGKKQEDLVSALTKAEIIADNKLVKDWEDTKKSEGELLGVKITYGAMDGTLISNVELTYELAMLFNELKDLKASTDEAKNIYRLCIFIKRC